MSKIPVGTVTDKQVDDALRQQVMSDLRTNDMGTIDDFDIATQRATIVLFNRRIKPTYSGNPVFTDPPLIDVPIIACVTAKGGLTLPISKGDACKVFFNDTSLQFWKENTQTPLQDDIYHSISYPCAIVFQGSKAIQNYDNEATTLWYNNKDEEPSSMVKLSDKKVVINTPAGTITIDNDTITIDASNEVKINNTITSKDGDTKITGTVDLGSAIAEVLNKNAVIQVVVPPGGTYPGATVVATIVSAGQTDVKA